MKPTAHAAGKGADWWGHVKFEMFSASLNTSTKHTHYDQSGVSWDGPMAVLCGWVNTRGPLVFTHRPRRAT